MNSGLRTRAITGFFFAIVMISGIYFHDWSLFCLFLIINILCLLEFQSIVEIVTANESRHPRFEKWFIAIIGVALYFLLTFVGLKKIPFQLMILLFPLTFLFFIKELFSKSRSPFAKISANLMNLLWITVPLSLVNLIAHFDGLFEPNRLMGILLLSWANDTFAYLVGSQIGRTKLFERISPNKTWEGTIGGFVGCLLTGALLSVVFLEFSLWQWVSIAAIVSVFGSLGDLIESLLKRSVNIKDSGNALPGHGGFLDRFDGFIFSIPFVYSFVYLWNFFN